MSDFKRVKPDEKVDACYGLEVLTMSTADFVAMKVGFELYATINESEYAIKIRVEDDEND